MLEDLKPWIELAAGIITLYFLLYRPMSENATSLKINTESNKMLQRSVEQISKDFAEMQNKHQQDKEEILEKKNEEHEKLWKHNSKQDQKIVEHEARISNLEKHNKIMR